MGQGERGGGRTAAAAAASFFTFSQFAAKFDSKL